MYAALCEKIAAEYLRAGGVDAKWDWKRTKTCWPVVENEEEGSSGIMRKKSQRNLVGEGSVEEEEEARPCTVALDCPSVRTSWTETRRALGTPEDGRIADYVHFRFARATTRISRRGNKLRS